MDSFVDKGAQRLTAQEMIKANAAAESAQYNECIQEMRKLNLKNMEVTDKITKLVDESIQKIEEMGASQNSMEDIKEPLEESMKELKNYMETLSEKSDDYLHKENVKVYRNVQAAIVEETAKQTETLLKAQKKANAKATAALVISIVAMAAILSDLVLNILMYLGVM